MVTKEDWATTKETEKDDRNKHTCAISITSATGGKAAGSHSEMWMAWKGILVDLPETNTDWELRDSEVLRKGQMHFEIPTWRFSNPRRCTTTSWFCWHATIWQVRMRVPRAHLDCGASPFPGRGVHVWLCLSWTRGRSGKKENKLHGSIYLELHGLHVGIQFELLLYSSTVGKAISRYVSGYVRLLLEHWLCIKMRHAGVMGPPLSALSWSL